MGALFVLLSAVGFGLMAIFAKLVYAEGVGVDELLMIRFGLAAGVLMSLSIATGALRTLGRRATLVGLGMGAIGYTTQAGFFLAALSRIDASLVTLVFSTYPLLVMVGSVTLGRDALSSRRLVALGIAMTGIALVVDGIDGGFDLVGVLLAAGSAVVYTCYILVGDRVVGDVSPVPLAAVVCTGAAASSTLLSVARGGPDLGFTAAGWGWLGAIVLVSTVGAILMFFAGLARVGPSHASLLSIAEPVVTVVGAALIFGERLSPAQTLGALLVLAALVLVQLPSRSRGRHSAAVPVAPPEPAVP